MKKTILMLFVAGRCFGQQQPIQDLKLLIGKQVVVQRMPMCLLGTYTVLLAYAGKQAKVLSLKPYNMTRLPEATLNRMAPAARAMIEDAQKSATILVQFEDDTQLDSCAPVRSPFGAAALTF